MERRTIDYINIDYYDKNEEYFIRPDSNYVIVNASPVDVVRITDLEQKGFSFHDRKILCRIALTKLNPRYMGLIRADVKMDKNFTTEIYSLANKAFITDRRFHLDKVFNQELAERVIINYIDKFGKEEFVFKCYHKNRLIGFTIVKPYNDEECENILGAVDPEYQGKGAAINLYAYMVKALAESGYKMLYGNISTTNIASINLHIALGGSFIKAEDEYIYRKNVS